MNYTDLIDHFKSVSAAAAAINRRRQTVHRWRRLNEVPLVHQVDFELLTGGKLRAELPEPFIELASRRLKERRKRRAAASKGRNKR